MISFILASQNLPFTIALALMLLIALLEGATSLLGAGLSSLLESIVPEMNIHMDKGTDAADLHTNAALSKVLGWLRFGQVPVLILLVIFLTAFGLLGLMIQSLATDFIGYFLPTYLAVWIALILAIPMVRLLGGFLAGIMPRDETEAVSEKSFIGKVAVITLGTARPGAAAQGKLKDEYGQDHYIMIEPDDDNDYFPQGAKVLIVRHQGAIFKAISNPSEVLED